MTGTEIKNYLYAQYNEIVNGVISSDRLNDLFLSASIIYFEPLINAFGLNGAVNDEIRALQATFSVTTPASNTLVLSTDLPDYERLVSVVTTYTSNGNTYVKTAIPLAPNSVQGSYSDGAPHYPRYYIQNGNILLYPQDITCDLAEGEYFREPYVIDVDDAVTDIPYTQKAIDGIVNEALQLYSASLRDAEFYAVADKEDKENNNVK